ncbi:hypothetical protein P9E34_04135 [Schinkia azotoformans]|uniref:hypothetical protein n=1 Tax=Schinkia azotoformans TaxID=1454 RepID=UPI002DBB5948|nr:hypothetical protein [Schinkia azotoformans]MEC1723935.1 hypothetical protein [Schinkia azotoformans]
MKEYNGPYWRSNATILTTTQLVDELFHYLSKWYLLKEDKMSQEDRYTTWNLPATGNELTNFIIQLPAPSYSHRAKNTCDLIMLMCAIFTEDNINMFIVFNIDESIVNSIERMNAIQKVEIASAILKQPKFKGTHVYKCLKEIVEWRNNYAHGKEMDMPKQETLKKTHIEHKPQKYPNLKDKIAKLIDIINDTYSVSEYLSSISTHEYTSGKLTDLEQLHENNKMIKKFYDKFIKNFKDIDDLW